MQTIVRRQSDSDISFCSSFEAQNQNKEISEPFYRLGIETLCDVYKEILKRKRGAMKIAKVLKNI